MAAAVAYGEMLLRHMKTPQAGLMAGFSFLHIMSQYGISSSCLTAVKNQLAVQFIMVQPAMFFVH
jgi:hypothetical protein